MTPFFLANSISGIYILKQVPEFEVLGRVPHSYLYSEQPLPLDRFVILKDTFASAFS
jgi:hypothetical protein